MTEQSFSRWFRQTSGLTFIDYLMQLRTTVASHLLINTNKPMSEVAEESGFNSSSSFNRSFLKVKGCSPREFRKKKKVGLTILLLLWDIRNSILIRDKEI